MFVWTLNVICFRIEVGRISNFVPVVPQFTNIDALEKPNKRIERHPEDSVALILFSREKFTFQVRILWPQSWFIWPIAWNKDRRLVRFDWFASERKSYRSIDKFRPTDSSAWRDDVCRLETVWCLATSRHGHSINRVSRILLSGWCCCCTWHTSEIAASAHSIVSAKFYRGQHFYHRDCSIDRELMFRKDNQWP